jgi:hypothetical protein
VEVVLRGVVCSLGAVLVSGICTGGRVTDRKRKESRPGTNSLDGVQPAMGLPVRRASWLALSGAFESEGRARRRREGGKRVVVVDEGGKKVSRGHGLLLNAGNCSGISTITRVYCTGRVKAMPLTAPRVHRPA